MPVEVILILGALLVTWLVFTWLIKVVRASIGTAIAIAAVILILQIFFGIGPDKVWQQIVNLPETITRIFSGK